METFHQTDSGGRIPVEIIARAIEYNKKTAVLCVARDITKRLEAVDALRESEERYRSVVENAHDGILLVDENLRIIFTNNECRRILQYSAEELTGRDFKTFLESFKLASEMENYLKSGADMNTGDEFDIRRKDGRIRRCKISVGMIGNPDGRQRSVLHLLDITERRKAQMEKKQLEQLLIQSQKMEAIGTLAGGIAHDFNNLLMAIQGRIALIELQLDPDDPNVEHIQAILRAVKSASGLTKQLLGYARGGKYQVKITDMNELVEKSAHMFSRTKKEITIHSEYDPALWPVAVDRGQIEQVMLNLYVNAWQAMPEGGTLTLTTVNVILDDHQCRPFHLSPGRYVMVTVRDTGIGMDESVRSRIFEPFFTTKKIGTGTGLGLASAYGIIRNHNGIIKAESQKGKGSTFSIFLPAVEKSIERAETGDETGDEVITGNETLLLVDAEEGVRQVGKLMVEELGYDLLTAANGEEAVSLYRVHAKRVSAVILDMTMPEMSGSETFKKLRQVNPGVRVILSSGYDMNSEINELRQRGYAGFIQKPFDLALLSKKIREVIDE
jgi:PAS domain S-box-containing protein